MHRRTFVAATAATAVIATAGRSSFAAADIPQDLEIIDCHTHFYDPTRPEGVPWPNRESSLYRTVLPQHLRAVPQFRRVTGTIVVEASPRVADNDWLLQLAQRDPFVVGIVGNLAPGHAEFASHARRLAAQPAFRGIRVSSTAVAQGLEKNQLDDFRLLADLGLALDVNGGPDTPALLGKLAALLPSLRIVLNHIGNVAITTAAPPADWQAGIASAAQHPRVYCKISALVEGAARDGRKAPHELAFYRPYLDVVWRAFGDERVIYGSNWPVSEGAADYATLQRIALEYAAERGDAALRRFCAGNSRAAYGR